MARAAAVADDRRLLDDVGVLARRRIARAQAWADARVNGPTGDLVGQRVHRLRVTWLRIAERVADGDPMLADASLAEKQYHAARDALGPTPMPVPWSRKKMAVVGASLVAASVGTWAVVRAVNAPPPPVGDGALLEPADEEALVDAVTQWVIGMDRWARARFDDAVARSVQEARDTLDARRGAIMSPQLTSFLGGDASEALSEVLDSAERTAMGRHWESDEAKFADAVRTLNRALADAGRAYFVDGYAALYPGGRPETALFLFRVAARRMWQVVGPDRSPIGDAIPALHLRRLDRLNIVQMLLGYTSKRMDVAALLLDQIEKEVVTRVGPAIAPGTDMPLEHDDDDAGEEWIAKVRAVAGERIRTAVEAEFVKDLDGMRELGALLAKRQSLVDAWQTELEERGVRLKAFDRYALDDEALESVQRYLGRGARSAVEEIQSELESAPRLRRFEALLARHARPVEQHEVQHRLDYALGDDFVVPSAVLELLDIDPRSELARHDDVLRLCYELSAYTSEIARDPAWAAIDLTLLAEHLFDRSGGAEGHAGILVLDGLREVLGLPGMKLADTPPVTPLAAAQAYLQLMQVPSDNLARAAETLWSRWFKRPLPALVPADAEVQP